MSKKKRTPGTSPVTVTTSAPIVTKEDAPVIETAIGNTDLGAGAEGITLLTGYEEGTATGSVSEGTDLEEAVIVPRGMQAGIAMLDEATYQAGSVEEFPAGELAATASLAQEEENLLTAETNEALVLQAQAEEAEQLAKAEQEVPEQDKQIIAFNVYLEAMAPGRLVSKEEIMMNHSRMYGILSIALSRADQASSIEVIQRIMGLFRDNIPGALDEMHAFRFFDEIAGLNPRQKKEYEALLSVFIDIASNRGGSKYIDWAVFQDRLLPVHAESYRQRICRAAGIE